MDNNLELDIRRNLDKVNQRIEKAAARARRDPSGIELVAVTKKKNALIVKTLYENGITKIGESYLQEAIFKIDLLKDLPIEWHMIGPIQSGKTKTAAQMFSVIHSVDRIEVARELSTAADKYGRIIPVYLEFNTSGETSKHGWNAWERSLWPKLLEEVEEVQEMNALNLKGLMTMAPYSEDPENARPYFRKLRELREYFNQELSHSDMKGLSMGMSGDFEVAVEEGATILRIGSALVGPR
jgi:pyridoxal phosphate enzyme (YggS family)